MRPGQNSKANKPLTLREKGGSIFFFALYFFVIAKLTLNRVELISSTWPMSKGEVINVFEEDDDCTVADVEYSIHERAFVSRVRHVNSSVQTGDRLAFYYNPKNPKELVSAEVGGDWNIGFGKMALKITKLEVSIHAPREV
jgi:hypothetical protein